MKFIIFPFNKFTNLNDIFEKTPAIDFELIYLAAIFSLFLVLALVFWLYYRRKKKKVKIWSRLQISYSNLFFYTGIVGLMLTFFRWQQIAYIGSRFFNLILILVFVAWFANILIYRYLIFSKDLKSYYEKEKFEKYLPKSHRNINK